MNCTIKWEINRWMIAWLCTLKEILVKTWKHKTYPLVNLLVKLIFTLLVTTGTIERSFSTMKYIKNELRNWMGDQWMNDCLVMYIERNVACSIDNETIMQLFQNMKTRKRQLETLCICVFFYYCYFQYMNFSFY